ncbi:MAG: protein kinase domain-containing protein, partial [Blastocatellia bacterium]
AKGIIHRDLKPENIFLTSSGLTSGGGVKILDFGIARVKHAVTPESETLTGSATKPGTVMGTIGYMSPEQVRGEQADAPSDIFSLGCVLYELASGQRPFSRATTAEVIAAILKEDPPDLAQSGLEIPNGLERLIQACLEKQSSARLRSARDLAQGLKAIADGRETQQILPARTRPRWRMAAMIGAVAAILLLGVLTWLSWVGTREQAIDSLAVLPLVNASRDAEIDYLSDGITDSVINTLSQLPKLRVMARSTVFTYKGKENDPRKVGADLKVRAVFTGRLTQRGDTLMIDVELVNAADGSRLWGAQYSRKLIDLIMPIKGSIWYRE